MKVFEGNNVSEAWMSAYNYILYENKSSHQDSRIGNTIEIMKGCFSVKNSRDRWVLDRKPMISPAFAIAEVFWILNGSNDANFINTWNPILKKYAGEDETYHGAYGHRLRYNLDFDQLEKAYETLKNNPESRQVVLQIWDGKKDLPILNGEPNSKDIPCNTSSLIKIRNNKLEWSQIMRSNDLFRGTPYNFIQFTTLQEILAGWLEIEIGEYFYFTDSLHIYENDIDNFSNRDNSLKNKNLDKLLFSKEQFDVFFPICIYYLEKIQKDGIEKEDIENLEKELFIPQEYKNLLLIPFAYIALKSNNIKLVKACEELCENKLLLEVWKFWKKEVYNN